MSQAMMTTRMLSDDDRGDYDLINAPVYSTPATYASSQPVVAAPQTAGTPLWQSILAAAGTGLTSVVKAYQQSQTPVQQPIYQPSTQPYPTRTQNDGATPGISTKVGFDLNSGLNIGGTKIPVLYLALGAGALFLLYKEPPRGRR